MVTGHDLTIFERVRIDIPKEKRLVLPGAGPLHSELLIEIAVVNLAAPTDADRVAAHQSADRCRIKRTDQQSHVIVELVIAPQITRETADRKVREGVEPIKHNLEMLLEFTLVVRLQFVL